MDSYVWVWDTYFLNLKDDLDFLSVLHIILFQRQVNEGVSKKKGFGPWFELWSRILLNKSRFKPVCSVSLAHLS